MFGMEEIFQIYLPIAEIKLDIVLLLAIGVFTGLLSGMFGLGGGLIVVPILMAVGVEPRVAVASATNQMTAASFSGYLAYARRGRVDYKLAAVMLAGGLPGAVTGVLLFRLLAEIGKLDVVVSLCFIVLLSSIGMLTLFDTISWLYYKMNGLPVPRTHHRFRWPIKIKLPLHIQFDSAHSTVSIFSPIMIGFVAGVLMAIMGIGGSLIMIPAMLYILHVSHAFTAGTSHLQIIFTTILATVLHAVTSNNLDIVLSSLLILGTAFGAQVGVKLGSSLHPEYFRLMLALVIFALCVVVIRGLLIQPDFVYTVEWLR